MAIVLKGFGKDSAEVILGFGGFTGIPLYIATYGNASIEHMICIYAEDRFVNIGSENRRISVYAEDRFVNV